MSCLSSWMKMATDSDPVLWSSSFSVGTCPFSCCCFAFISLNHSGAFTSAPPPFSQHLDKVCLGLRQLGFMHFVLVFSQFVDFLCFAASAASCVFWLSLACASWASASRCLMMLFEVSCEPWFINVVTNCLCNHLNLPSASALGV